jgi:uncharacterized membrane protein
MSSFADQAREREHRRRMLGARLRRRLPALLPDYAELLTGTVIGFGIVTILLDRFTSVDPMWVLGSVALLYSARSAYYERRLAADPGFALPKCGCGGRVNDRTEAVLGSRYARVLGIPVAALGAALYIALLVCVGLGANAPAAGLAAFAVGTSAFLGYAMVVRIGALCPACVTIAGLNLLLLWQAAAGW